MKRNPDYLLRDVAGRLVLVPVGAAARDFPGMITCNETSRFLWELLETDRSEEELTDALLREYNVSPQQAQADVQSFLNTLLVVGAVTESL